VLSLRITDLETGKYLEYSGDIYIMRDAAQRRLMENFPSSLDLEGAVVFYAGPAKTPDGDVCGSIGPTTSDRMDGYLEFLYKKGVMATIGKGDRGKIVRELNRNYGRAYFVAPSGAAAYLSRCFRKIRAILYNDLGPEAIFMATVERMPLVVAIDKNGSDIFRREKPNEFI
jgi:fumarate hydratase subunit beta